MKLLKVLTIVLSAAILMFFVYLLVQGDRRSQVITQPKPSPTPINQSIDNRMTWDEADAYLEEKYGQGFFDATPSAKPITSVSKTQPRKIDLDEKSTCWVDKNGSFEMTARECQELHDSNPFQFQVKSYQYCLEGKNPQVGDVGSSESRKEKCSDLTGITEKE